jgi:hypothetical protein
MQTRSQTQRLKQPLYQVDIDFDGASEAWKKNKQSRGNGTYTYMCGQTTKSGTICNKVRASGCNYCRMHSKNKNQSR